ncbi:MAG TPA: hypothetical protein PKK69_10175 [Ferruginibacter sp.]|nr:hypothetical protein [Ferruginibacter sp.]
MKGKFITTQIRIVCLGNRLAVASEAKNEKRRTVTNTPSLPLVAVHNNSQPSLHDHFQAA